MTGLSCDDAAVLLTGWVDDELDGAKRQVLTKSAKRRRESRSEDARQQQDARDASTNGAGPRLVDEAFQSLHNTRRQLPSLGVDEVVVGLDLNKIRKERGGYAKYKDGNFFFKKK